MLDAQAATYGDAIDPATYHRYMWLWKPHYYTHEHNFYNFPYAFGHLFSLGLYAIYRQTGAALRPALRRPAAGDQSGLRRPAGRAFWHRHHPARFLARKLEGDRPAGRAV